MRRSRRLASLLAFGVLTAACSVEPATHHVTNESGQTVTVFYEAEDGEYKTRTLEPGKAMYMNFLFGTQECSQGALIARTADGVEVDRRTDRLCPGDTWVIDDAAN